MNGVHPSGVHAVFFGAPGRGLCLFCALPLSRRSSASRARNGARGFARVEAASLRAGFAEASSAPMRALLLAVARASLADAAVAGIGGLLAGIVGDVAALDACAVVSVAAEHALVDRLGADLPPSLLLIAARRGVVRELRALAALRDDSSFAEPAVLFRAVPLRAQLAGDLHVVDTVAALRLVVTTAAANDDEGTDQRETGSETRSGGEARHADLATPSWCATRVGAARAKPVNRARPVAMPPALRSSHVAFNVHVWSTPLTVGAGLDVASERSLREGRCWRALVVGMSGRRSR